MTLHLATSQSMEVPPRITVPLDMDVSNVSIPQWIDLTVDYWALWRHHFDKWNIQLRFAKVNNSRDGDATGIDIARKEIDKLFYIREKLLMDHPDRQDIDIRSRRAVKHVWRYLCKAQAYGVKCTDFRCSQVEQQFGWNTMLEDEDMWDHIGEYLMEQGVEERIFIDPRLFYPHFSWTVVDSGKEVTDENLAEFYDQFAQQATLESSSTTIECDECTGSAKTCLCEETCLLCLPQVQGIPPVSPLSSLPSPPRTPGTQSLHLPFKGKRLPHPPPPVETLSYTGEDAANILLGFAGLPIYQPNEDKRRGRQRKIGV
jgi:hypothetical protein